MREMFEERAAWLATGIKAEVRGQMEKKLNELHLEFQARFNEEFEIYRQRVLNNIQITHQQDVIGDQSRIIFDIKINREEMTGRRG